MSTFFVNDWFSENRSLLIVTISAGVIIPLALLLVKIQWTKPQETEKRRKNFPPLPPEGPKFAEFFQCLKAQNQLQAIQTYGHYYTTKSILPGIIPTQVVIDDPAVVTELTVTQQNMYRTPSRFTTRSDLFAAATRSVVGVGVTGLKGDEWKWRKTALLKEFHKNRLQNHDRGLVDCIVQTGKQLCRGLDAHAAAESESSGGGGDPVAVDVLTTGAAVTVILFFLFGRRLEFDAAEMRQSAKDLMDCLGFLFTHPFHGIAKHIPGSQSYKMELRKKHAWAIIDAIVATEIELLLQEHAGTVAVHPDRKPGSVIASLIANEPRFRDGGVDSMIAEARVFVQAGFETTAHSLSFSLGMMAERPDLAQKMATAGRQALAAAAAGGEGNNHDWNSEMIAKALDETAIVKNFFYESVRLYPLAPTLGGECTDDIVIQTTSGETYGLAKGTACSFPNLANQRHVDNPDTIIPERWDVPLNSQPFLHTFQNGAHSCPGKPLSLLEGHVFLLMIATQFEFSFPHGIEKVEFEDNLLLRPKDGMPLLVKKRVS